MRGWLLVLAAVVAASLALAYLVTDDAFRGLWFPKLAEAAGVEASAAEATWDPLSGFTAKGVKFSGAGGFSGEVDEIQASWNAAEILRATVALNSLSVTGARVVWRTGKKAGVGGGGRGKEDSRRMGGPTVLGFAVECGPVALRNIDVVVKAARGGTCMTNRIEAIELSGWRAGADVRAKGRVGLAGSLWQGLELEKAMLSCDLKLTLSSKLEVNGADGWVKFGECRGRSGDMRLDGLEIEHTILLTPFWLRSAVLTATMKGRPLGRCAANGQVDFNLKTCDVVLLVEDIDPELVSAFTASRGLWMTTGRLRLTGQYQVRKASRRLQGEGEMRGACFDNKAGPSAFPPIEGRCAFAAEHFPEAEQLVIERAQVSLVEGDSVLAAAGLDRPMKLSWGEKSKGGEAAELALRIPETDMRRVAHFVEAACGARVAGGTVGGRGRLVATSGGRALSWEGSVTARDLTGEWRGQSLEGMAVSAASAGRWRGGAMLEVSNAMVRAEGPPEKSASVSVSGGRTDKGESWKFSASLGRDWLRGWGMKRFAVAEGTAEGTAAMTRSPDGTGVLEWKAVAEDLTGEGGALRFEKARLEGGGEVRFTGGDQRVIRAVGVVRPGGDSPAGEILAEGPWRDASGGGRLEVKLRGWSDRNLRHVLAPQYYGSSVASAGDLEGLAVFERRSGRWTADAMAALHGARFLTGSPEAQAARDLVLVLKGRFGADRFDIAEGSVSLGKVGEVDNRLSVTGGFDLAGPGIDLQIKGGVFDPSVILPLIVHGSASPGLSQSDAREGAGPGDAEPGLAAEGRKGDAGQGAGDVRGRIGFEIGRCVLGGVETKLTGDLTKAGSRWREGNLKLVSESGHLKCRLHWPRKGAWGIDANAKDFPMVAVTPFLSGSREYLTGAISGEASCAGDGGWRPETLHGKGQFTWSGASAEKFPTIRSFLKSAAKRVTSELADCHVSGMAGGFEVAGGDWHSKDLSFSGDTMKLWFVGGVDHEGRIEGEARFAGKTDMMQRSRVRLGTIEVGGMTFVAFGKADGEFTVLPGSLPVRGSIHGDLEADWDGWLRSVGLGSLSGLIENLGGRKGGRREGKDER